MEGTSPGIGVRLAGGVAVVDAAGEIDLPRADELLTIGREALRMGAPVVLNLTRCELIDSTGLSAVIAVYHEARATRTRFALAVVAPDVKRVLNTAGIETQIPCFGSLSQAMEYVGAEPSEQENG